jgi:hypothetical protein
VKLLTLALAGIALAPLPARADTVFRFPANDPEGKLFYIEPIMGVDHDPEDDPLDTSCVNYAGEGFPYCYDQHDGTDFLLRSGFVTMDQFDVEVVAAADGTVVATEDGNYDRCSGAPGLSVDCGGHPIQANFVEIEHDGGLLSAYYHLKKSSVQVAPGERVSCGQVLGFVGSSGYSATPHLHFEVRGAAGQIIDPFAGPMSQPRSYWVEQHGALGWPAARCAGAPAASDAGLDSAPAGGGEGALVEPYAASGCAAAPRHEPASSPGAKALFFTVWVLLWGWAWVLIRTC